MRQIDRRSSVALRGCDRLEQGSCTWIEKEKITFAIIIVVAGRHDNGPSEFRRFYDDRITERIPHVGVRKFP